MNERNELNNRTSVRRRKVGIYSFAAVAAIIAAAVVLTVYHATQSTPSNIHATGSQVKYDKIALSSFIGKSVQEAYSMSKYPNGHLQASTYSFRTVSLGHNGQVDDESISDRIVVATCAHYSTNRPITIWLGITPRAEVNVNRLLDTSSGVSERFAQSLGSRTGCENTMDGIGVPES